MRPIRFTLLAGLLLVAPAPSAFAEAPGVAYSASSDGGRISVEVEVGAYGGSQGRAGGGGGSDRPEPIALSLHNCIPIFGTGGIPLSHEIIESPGGDCATFDRPDEVPKVAVDALVRRATDAARAHAGAPALRTAPGRIALVGLRTFVWATPPRPVVVTASVPGLSVTAEASPSTYSWDMGDGTRFATDHPGRAWTPGSPGELGHVFRRRGRLLARVRVLWTARVRIEDGAWKKLASFTTGDERWVPVRDVVSALLRSRR